MNKIKYKNKQGIDFDIEFLTADVPSEADYFGFLVDVVANANPKTHHTYKAIVKKNICSSEESARMWLNSTALDFLNVILDTYQNGRTLLLLPASKGNWFIL